MTGSAREAVGGGAGDGDGADALFAGPGEVRALARALDWGATPLGWPERWAPALRAATRAMLDAPFPMCLWSGPEYALVYNDAYRRILAAKHPAALGQPGAVAWGEIWAELAPHFARVRDGGPPVFAEDARFVLARLEGGEADEAWFSYSLSAQRDEDGAVIAILNIAAETTARVRAERVVATERARLFEAFQRVPSFVSVVTGADHVLAYANEAYFALVGRRDIMGRPVWEALPDARGQGFEALLDGVRDTGVPVVGREAPLRLVRTAGAAPEERFVDFVYQALADADGTRWGVMGHGTDVTDQVRARREVERLLADSEAANAQLREQALELELSNQQLRDQAVELELQAEELHATAAELEERSEEAEKARAQAERERARAAGILEATADAYFALDGEFRIVSVNAAMERSTGLAREALLGRLFWDMFPATVGTQFERHYRAAASDGVAAHFTDSYDDGRLTLVSEADVYPVAGGGIAVFWRDVTARVRAEAALRESEARFRNMADAAPVMLWVTQPDGSCSFLSRAWLEFTGQTLEEGLGYGWLDAVHPEDRPRAERDFLEANARREPFRADYRLRRHDGTYRWATDAAAPRLGPGGDYLGYVGSVLDVDERTQLLRAEQAARIAAEQARASAEALSGRAEASEARARQLFALSPLPKWVYDAETLAFLEVNEAAVRHYGYARAEFLALTIRDIRPPEEIPRMLAVAQERHLTGASQGVFHHRTKAGAIIDVEVFLRDVPYEGRRAVIAVVQDVTERRRAEAALLEASRAAAAARDAAEAANAAKSQFLSTMSHELRTPLNAIAGYADLLTLGLRGPLTEAQRQDLERLRRANQHLTGLVTDVLNFARLDAGRVEYRTEDVELGPLIADLETLIGPQIADKALAFDRDGCAPDTPDRPHVVRADAEKVRQVLLNLLSNAVKFTDAGGRVALACEADADAGAIRLRVSDTGRGIPADQLERIFEPFVQVDRHRTPDSQQGVGLGLAISRDLARGMGGELGAESTPGVGSTFTLTLPAAV